MDKNENKENNKVIRFTIPIRSEKKWWQFWKKSITKSEISDLIKLYKEEINFDDFDDVKESIYMNPEKSSYWIPSAQPNRL